MTPRQDVALNYIRDQDHVHTAEPIGPVIWVSHDGCLGDRVAFTSVIRDYGYVPVGIDRSEEALQVFLAPAEQLGMDHEVTDA